MNKIVKYGLYGAGAVVFVAASGAAYLVATFNPNDYKEQIVRLVKDSRQRTLHLDGDIKLSFFPSIGADLGRVSLSEFKSDQPFAAVDAARVSLALLPLLRSQVVVDEVLVSGLTAKLIKHRDGTTNVDDLLGKGAASDKQSVKFDIAQVRIEKTNLTYHDEASDSQFVIKDMNLKTGRIANGVPGRINLSAGVQGNRPELDVKVKLDTRLTFDLDKQQYQFTDMDLQVFGNVLDISNLKLAARGGVSANLTAQEFSADKFKLSATGIKARDSFDATMDLPSLNLAKDKYSGEGLTLNAGMEGTGSKIVALFSLPRLAGNAASFNAPALTLDVDVKQSEQAFKIRLASILSGSLQTKKFDLSNLDLVVNATGDKLPNKSVDSEMKGRVQVDAGSKTVQGDLSGGLLQSQIKAKFNVNVFSDPALHFDVDVDQFDADPYLPKKKEAVPAQPEQPFDLSALRALNLEGSLRIGRLKVANITSTGVRLDIKAHKGLLDVRPLSANLYQGGVSGSLSVNAAAVPIILINQKLTGVDVAALTRDAAGFDTLEGRGNIAMNLSMQGNTVGAMKKLMNGNLSLNLTDGAIKGINIARKLREAQGALGRAQTQSANQSEKTDFSELKASFKVQHGVAHNDDLALKSPLLRLAGAGDVDIGNNRMSYLAKATLARTLEGQGGRDDVGGITVPVRISGPFSDLKYTLDFAAMAGELAKQKVEAKKTEIKARVQDQLKNSLKGLFR